jgi:GTP-binding protein
MSTFQRATYAMSVHDPALFPPNEGSEVAFAGRSNSGKSSAINALTGRRRLAHVSKTPGRTQAINFFSVEEHRFLVDLPGYGYAAVAAAEKRHWKMLIGAYIQSRLALRGLIVVMDARHAFGPLDGQLLEWIKPRGLACHVLLTKADKLSARERSAARLEAERAAQRLTAGSCSLQFFSSKTGEGVDTARGVIVRWLDTK